MTGGERFTYTATPLTDGRAATRPFLPLTLGHSNTSVAATGLLDTGAEVNVLPYHLGSALGAVWLAQRTIAPLGPRSARPAAEKAYPGYSTRTLTGGVRPIRTRGAHTRPTCLAC